MSDIAGKVDDAFGCHTLVGGERLVFAHDPAHCAGQPCALHDPSEHHMREWPQHWREDRRILERICPHGTAHPDPDALSEGDHVCDGCCRPCKVCDGMGGEGEGMPCPLCGLTP